MFPQGGPAAAFPAARPAARLAARPPVSVGDSVFGSLWIGPSKPESDDSYTLLDHRSLNLATVTHLWTIEA